MELLITIAIIFSVTALAVVGYQAFKRTKDLSTTAEKLESTLRKAQNASVVRENDLQYSVRIEANRYIYFIGDTYLEGAPTNQVILIPDTIEVVSITLEGDGIVATNNVIFDKITGKANGACNILLRSAAEHSLTRTVTVSSAGLVETN